MPGKRLEALSLGISDSINVREVERQCGRHADWHTEQRPDGSTVTPPAPYRLTSEGFRPAGGAELAEEAEDSVRSERAARAHPQGGGSAAEGPPPRSGGHRL
ncbi:hypothetical protein ABPG77_005300 [Micractinium sp. CCAP 211/92]